MFAKKFRLAKSADVQKVFGRGRAFFNPLLTVKFLGRQDGMPRVAVIVSTKVAKSAVRRNRIKRVLRELLRTNIGKLKAGDYAIVVKPLAAQKQPAPSASAHPSSGERRCPW